jgi:YVTN family beta-propeller protein
MYSNSRNGSRAASARGFMALFAVLAMGLGAMQAAAAPFAYVANAGDNTVSVIDTATNMVVATIPVGGGPAGVAVVPDGKHVYVTNGSSNTVSVVDTATNMVVATIPLGGGPAGVAVTPDGKHVYVAAATAPLLLGQVSVIDTGSNTVVATVTGVGQNPVEIAITPDGRYAYVTFRPPQESGAGVSVIATASNTVVATVGVGFYYTGVHGIAITPDGKHAYVSNITAKTVMGNPVPIQEVSVIDTASNTVVASVQGSGGQVVLLPGGVAVTPDGTRAYVADFPSFGTVAVIAAASNTVVATVTAGERGEIAITPDGKSAYVTGGVNVAVIDTASNTVVDTIPVGNGPRGVAIIPDVPFLGFGANLVLAFGGAGNQDFLALQTSFILSSTAPVINPLTQPVTFQAGTFAVTILPGSFKMTPQGFFIFAGVINGVRLEVLIENTGTLQYALQAKAVGASFSGTKNPVTVRLSIGVDSGTTSVNAKIFH